MPVTTSPAGVRVLIVDEHPDVREALAQVLGTSPGIREARAVGGAAEALALAETWQPDVVLLETKRRDGDGLDLLRRLLRGGEGPPVLVVTSYPDAFERLEVMYAGGSGYLLKGMPAEVLVAEVLGARRGRQHPAGRA